MQRFCNAYIASCKFLAFSFKVIIVKSVPEEARLLEDRGELRALILYFLDLLEMKNHRVELYGKFILYLFRWRRICKALLRQIHSTFFLDLMELGVC